MNTRKVNAVKVMVRVEYADGTFSESGYTSDSGAPLTRPAIFQRETPVPGGMESHVSVRWIELDPEVAP